MCQDSALNYLNYVGYNVIALPREGVDPMQILAGKEQRLSPIGALPDFVTGGAQAPSISRDEQAGKIASQRGSRLDAGAGLGVTERFLQAMGARGSLKGHYQRAAHIQILFEEVLRDAVVAQHIDDYLAGVQAKPRSLLLAAIEDHGCAWIITETLKSRSFGVLAFDAHGEEMQLDASAIEGVLGGEVKVNGSGRHKHAVYYQGPKWLRFGFKALELTVDPMDKQMAAALRVRLKDREVVMRGPTAPGFHVFTPDQLIELG